MSSLRRLGALFVLCAAAAAAAPAAGQTGFGDPTRPTSLSEPEPERAAVQGPRWRLQSTLVADTRRLAVINGRTVAQGGLVDGARLLEVRPDGVTLEQGGRQIVLRLPGSLNMKRSGG